MHPSDMTPEEHIKWIREEEFGLAPDGSIVRYSPLSGRLQRAIRHLSDGLYSKETHFILELVQNAEDNHYDEGVKPDLTFILSSADPTGTRGADGSLVVINNEIGLRAEDVNALCDVGVTTKDKREGYIGEKGIGFKSVFVVSSRPHIFSRGYRFWFQEEPDSQIGLGYIVPYWIYAIPQEIEDYRDKTCIVLPLKYGKREKVARDLETIAPETVLFLSKLQGLTIQIENQKSLTVIWDHSNKPLVRFMAGEQYAEFWEVEQKIPVPPDLQEEKREGVTTRKVSVAFPLTEEGDFESRVFAFLPIEVNSGLPFLVNADFILSTARESIQFGLPWNHWLRDCIAPTYVQAFESLLDHPDHKFKAYSYIPLSDDIQEDFFRPTTEAIQAELSERAVVWSFEDERLVKPSEARLAPRAFRELLAASKGTPAQLLETPLVDPAIEAYRDRLQAIGVRGLSSEEIVNCLEDEAWLDSQNLEWFIVLYEYLRRQSRVTEGRLQELRLLPLEGDGRSNTTEQPVYFPVEDVHEVRQLQAQTSYILPIAFLNPDLYELILDDQSLIEWLTDALGVRELTLPNYCVDLARVFSERQDEVIVPDLVPLTAHIRDRYDNFDYHTQLEIKRLLPFALVDGTIAAPEKWNDDHPLVMPEAMDPETGWQLVFADPEDRAHMAVLSDAYLADCDDEEEVNKWRDFFEAMGATDTPCPRQKHWRFYDLPSYITGHTRDVLSSGLEYSTWGHRVQDWTAPKGLRSLEKTRNLDEWTEGRSFSLLGWLERQASQAIRVEFLYRARYMWHYYKWHSKWFDSELKYCLRHAPWFLSTHGLKRPSEVFLDRPELREVFGDALPYALENPSEEVAEWLGLRQTATAGELLDYLQELASKPAEMVDRKVVREIYRFLLARRSLDFKDQFRENPLILVSKPQARWVTAEQAVWPDLRDVFGEAYFYLAKEYSPRYKEFFVEQVGVADQLSQELYAQAWTQLTRVEDIQAHAVVAALERIYPELLKVAKGNEQPAWWREFCNDPQVWTQNDTFEPAHLVYVPDDGEFKRLFAEEDVEFAWRPEKVGFAEYQPLYRALGVRSLVEAVKASAQVQEVIETDGCQPLLTAAAKKAICFYLWNANRSEYERTKEIGVLEALLKTREQAIDNLTVSYELDWTTVEIPDSTAYWQQDECVLYRSAAHSPDQLEVEVPAILARRLSSGRSSNPLENFIGRILGASESKAESIVRKHNWSLPSEEREWIDEILTSLLQPPEPELGLEPILGSGPKPGSTPGSGPEPRLGPGPKSTPKPGPGSKAGAVPTPSPKPGSDRFRPRMVSYVEPRESGGDGGSSGTGGSQEEREAIERAGIEAAMTYEWKHEREPEEKERTHKGYDIVSYEKGEEESVAAILDQEDRRKLARIIEVKATKHEWDDWGVGLTAPEHQAAQEHGDMYYLYVVEYALDPNKRKLYVFQNPRDKINDYRFDGNWRVIADETD